MKKLKHILILILLAFLCANSYSQITVIELTNKHDGYIYITEGSTIHIDTMEVPISGYNSYKFTLEDVQPYVVSDSIELQINIIGFKPIKQKYSVSNNRIQIKLEEKQHIKTLSNDSLVDTPFPLAIGVKLIENENLCIVISGLVESADFFLYIRWVLKIHFFQFLT